MIYALLLTAAFIGLALQVLGFVIVNLRLAQGCTCAKGRWDPSCPVHGRETAT